MDSSANPRVREPKIPIASTTVNIATAINANTPRTPKLLKKNPIIRLVKIALNRLHE